MLSATLEPQTHFIPELSLWKRGFGNWSTDLMLSLIICSQAQLSEQSEFTDLRELRELGGSGKLEETFF